MTDGVSGCQPHPKGEYRLSPEDLTAELPWFTVGSKLYLKCK